MWTHDFRDLKGPLPLTSWPYESFWNLDTSPGKRGILNGLRLSFCYYVIGAFGRNLVQF